MAGRRTPGTTAAALIVGIGGVALAATRIQGAGSNTINGCFNKTSGALTVLTHTHKSCCGRVSRPGRGR